MTKQEKVVAWMASLGFEPEKQPAESYAMWSNGILRLSHVQATFFYEVMVKARLNEIEEAYNDFIAFDESHLGYLKARMRHLKQEGKTNG
jgi:hypothetical protein